MILAAAAAFIPVAAVAEVRNSKGSHYRVDTCFVAPDKLDTRFTYPDRTATFTIRGDAVTVGETGKPAETGGDAERRFAIGHNFHALVFNASRWGKGDKVELPYGGSMTVAARRRGVPSKLQFDLPGTTPISISFREWRGKTPFRMELHHAGVIYDYRYRSIDRRCDLA